MPVVLLDCPHAGPRCRSACDLDPVDMQPIPADRVLRLEAGGTTRCYNVDTLQRWLRSHPSVEPVTRQTFTPAQLETIATAARTQGSPSESTRDPESPHGDVVWPIKGVVSLFSGSTVAWVPVLPRPRTEHVELPPQTRRTVNGLDVYNAGVSTVNVYFVQDDEAEPPQGSTRLFTQGGVIAIKVDDPRRPPRHLVLRPGGARLAHGTLWRNGAPDPLMVQFVY